MTWRPSRAASSTSQRKLGFSSGAAGDVHDRDVGLGQGREAQLGRVVRHDLAPVRSSVNVAVVAGLVAELADVDLKYGDARRAQGVETDGAHLLLKGWDAVAGTENTQLLPGCGQGTAARLQT